MNSKIFCGIIFSSHRLGTLGRKNTKKITPETVSRTPSALFFWRFKNDTVTKLLAIVGHVFLNFLGCGPSKKLEDPFSPRKKALNHKKSVVPPKTATKIPLLPKVWLSKVHVKLSSHQSRAHQKTVPKKVLEIQSHQRPPKVSANLPSMGIGTPSMINVCRNFHRLFVSRNFPSFPTSMAYS